MFASCLLVAATASVLVTAQFQPAAPGCTTKSFAIPSWFVTDLQYSSAGNASFQITNRANNYTADLTCAVGGNGWSACTIQGSASSSDALHASLQVSQTSAQILVNQTWTCSDRTGAKLAPFVAVGNNTVALKSDGQNYVAVDSPLLVKGSLLSPVAITPVYAWGPTGHDKPGCAAAAQNVSWTLTTPFYTNQTGDGITDVASQDFTVLVTNPATGYQAGCMSGAAFADGTTNPATGLLNLVCAGTEFQSTGGGAYSITTAATFDPSTFTFSINQTWYCDDVDQAKPVQITASGSASLPLTCTSIPLETVDTKLSCIYHEDVAVAGKLVSQQALAPYSLEEPVLGADDCTLSSIFNPQWTFSDFEVDFSPSNASSVSFGLILRTGSPGFQYPISITQGTTPVAGSGSWYPCVIGPNGNIGEVLWPTDCSFQYQPETKQLTFKADWACGDLDPDHPILFSGVTTTTINSPLTCETVQGLSECVTTNGAYTWTAPISNVTWHQ